jgi:uncharacterized protein YacL (UPF0231 family)
MTLISCYRDDTGLLRARAADKDQLLAVFLETDIQEDKDMAIELLRQVKALQNGEKKRYETSGNAHTVTMTPKAVTIESLFDDEAPRYRLKLAHFRDILTQWADKI